MSVTPITTHVVDALNRLLQQYKDKDSIRAIVSAKTEQDQVLEDVFQDLENFRGIDTATGVQLDGLGDILGIERQGLNDEDYRARLKVKVVQNVSNGEPDRLINVYRFLLNATQIQYQEHYPAGVAMMANAPITPGMETLIYREIQKISPAGVRVDYIGSYDPDDAFAFEGAGGPLDLAGADGFGDLLDAGVGGMLGYQHIPIENAFAFEGGNPIYLGLGDLRDPYYGGLFQ